jgi:hypothetical protein
MQNAVKSLALIGLILSLVGCTTPPPSPPVAAGDWQPVLLPGKSATDYRWETKAGRRSVAARADHSASMWRRDVSIAAVDLGQVQFSWWVQSPLPGADLAAAGQGDAPARVLFAFAGDHRQLSPRNRMLFDLAETLSGERPPFATLMYVYGPEGAAADDVLVHTRTDRVRKIVVDAGQAHARQWRDHRRDLAADFRRAFGEEPGALLSVALMTDADNTRQTAQAWYGPIEFLPR